jgi:hypothetical protein
MRATAFPGEDPESLKPAEAVSDAVLGLSLPECQSNGELVSL